MKTIWAILCPLILATLVSGQYQNLGITKIKMSTHAWMGMSPNCGGDQVKIQLVNQNQASCEVSLSGEFDRNKVVVWSSDYELWSCKDMSVTDSTMVKVQTTSSDSFCPKAVTIEASNGKKYESKMRKQWYDQDTNNFENPLSKIGIKRIVMPMFDDQLAGGKKIKIKIIGRSQITGDTNGDWCTTKVIPIVYGRQVVSWEGEELNGCEMMDINSNTDVYLQTEKRGDVFAPRRLEIEMNDMLFTRWEVRLGYLSRNEYGFDRNSVRLGVKQMWPIPGKVMEPRPTPLICPGVEDTCSVSEMYAYKLLSNRRMNCVFECPHVSQTNYSLNIHETDGTGHRCIETNYDSSQFNWCCKSKATSGIPKCSDVIGSNGQVLEVENNSQPPPQRTQLQCPSQGCPIFALEEKPAPGYVANSCQPGCGKLNALDSTESGFRCNPVTYQLPKTIFCCKDNQVNTTLPRCDSLSVEVDHSEDNNGDSTDPGNPDENETSEDPLNVATYQVRVRIIECLLEDLPETDGLYTQALRERRRQRNILRQRVDFDTCMENLQQNPDEHLRQLREEHGEESVTRCLSQLAFSQDAFNQCIN